MTGESSKRKRLLFVDDDAAFLGVLTELFAEMSRGTWEIVSAHNHAEALAALQRQRMDLVVLDLGMPVMDGAQLLRLLGRTHPGQQIAMLTGLVTEANRKLCLDNGAVLFLQKPVSQPEFASVFAALDALAGARGGEGFQGVMQRVGLHEVLQFECLGRRSTILEVFSGKASGKIYISDGAIVHAESGTLQGEVALYNLLALRGGGFNLMAYAEPPKRTIEGSWEMLLMESARLSDEAAQAGQPETSVPQPEIEIPSAVPIVPEAAEATAPPPAPAEGSPARIVEVILCTGSSEVLYDWECPSLERRLALMEQIEQLAQKMSGLATVGRFDRLEVTCAQERAVCEIQPHRRLFVRSVRNGGPPA